MVADVLALEVDEVRPEDSFVTKLAGDSLGFLELSFQCEKRYGIKLPFQKVIPEEALVADGEGVLTAESVALLKRELPFLDYERLGERPLKGRLLELLTVEAIAHLVRRRWGRRRRGSYDRRDGKATQAAPARRLPAGPPGGYDRRAAHVPREVGYEEWWHSPVANPPRRHDAPVPCISRAGTIRQQHDRSALRNRLSSW
jgi:acyl carrier protein